MGSNKLRLAAGIVSVTGLLLIFLIQPLDFAGYLFDTEKPIVKFLINRSFRLIINDFLAILLIYALFEQRKYVIFAIGVQIAGLFLFLLPYFILKIYHPGYNGPLINFLHRIILNPTLMLLLIPAFYYQKRMVKS